MLLLAHKDKIDRVLIQYPDLTSFGFGSFGSDVPKQEAQQELYDLAYEFNLCGQFIGEVGLTKTIGNKRDSYWHKHRVENWHFARSGQRIWIGNGVLIAALVHNGAKLRRDGPNCWANLRLYRAVKRPSLALV